MIIWFFYKERVCAYMYIYFSARITQVTLSRNVIFFYFNQTLHKTKFDICRN